MAPAAVKPVRVKVYGLFPMTRRTYVVFQVVGLCVVTGLMAIGLAAMIPARQLFPRFSLPPAPIPADWWLLQALLSLFWLGLLTLLVEVVETLVVLKKFARAEALARAGQGSADTAPAPAPSVPNPQP
jgi:hypothetical protein